MLPWLLVYHLILFSKLDNWTRIIWKFILYKSVQYSRIYDDSKTCSGTDSLIFRSAAPPAPLNGRLVTKSPGTFLHLDILQWPLFKFLTFRLKARFVGVKWRHFYNKFANRYRYRYGAHIWLVDHTWQNEASVIFVDMLICNHGSSCQFL